MFGVAGDVCAGRLFSVRVGAQAKRMQRYLRSMSKSIDPPHRTFPNHTLCHGFHELAGAPPDLDHLVVADCTSGDGFKEVNSWLDEVRYLEARGSCGLSRTAKF